MGLFSSEKKYHVATSVTKMIEDNPKIIPPAMLMAVFNNLPVTGTMLDLQLNGYNAQVNKYYRKGRDSPYIGLPTGTLFTPADKNAEVTAVLSEIEGAPVTLVESLLDYAEADALAVIYMAQNLGYDPAVGTIDGTLIGVSESLTYQDAYVAEFGMLGITFTYGSVGEEVEVVREFSMPNIGINYLIYHVIYEVSGETKYWYYVADTEVYPSLSIKVDTEYGNTFMPIVPIRENGRNLNELNKQKFKREVVDGVTVPGVDVSNLSEEDEKTYLQYKDSKKMLSHLGVGMDEIIDSLNENPGIKDIDDSFICFGARPNSKEPAVLEYLFEFFQQRAYQSNASTLEEYKATIASGASPPLNSFNVNSQEFRTRIYWSWMNLTTVEGSIGAIGDVTSEITTEQVEDDNAPKGRGLFSGVFKPVGVLTLCKQLTEDSYVQLEVGNLITNSYIHRKAEREANISLLDKDNELFIPLDYGIVKQFSGKKESEIYYDSLIIVNYSLVVEKVKWYQKKWFRVVIIIVVVVLVIISAGAALTWAGLATTTATDIFLAIVLTILVSAVVKVVFSYIAESIGGDLGLFLATVSSAALVYYTYDFASALDAMTWLDAAIIALDSANTYVNDSIGEVYDEITDLTKEYEERQEEFEEAYDLLGDDARINLFDIIAVGPYNDPYETPEQFYNRTTHMGNPGVLSLDALHNWVEMHLTLPEHDYRDTNLTA